MKNRIKNVYVKSKFSCIMSIVSFLVGVFFMFLTKGDTWRAKLIISSIVFFPFVFFLTITILMNSFSRSEVIQKVLLIIAKIGAFLFLFYYAMSIWVCAFIEADNPITNLRSYHDKVNDERLLKVFPKEIPSTAENVKFFFRPGFLQGGTEVALYYADNHLDKNLFERKYRDKAIWIGYKEEYVKEEGLLVGAFSNTPAEFQNEEDFIIYLVEGNCDNSGYCNHGNFLLVALNENTKEIIFKSKEW